MCDGRWCAIVTAATLAALLALTGCGGGGGGGSMSGGDGGVITPPPPETTDSQFRVSGVSPLVPGCQGAGNAGTLYVNAEVEPYVAVDPLDANHLLGVWQQDRWANGGAQGILTGVSLDGGRTWSTRMAPFTRCTGGTADNGGDYQRASDPWVTFAADGTAYQSAIVFTGTNFASGSTTAILVSRSADGGRTWSNAFPVIREGPAFFNDKDAITADPTDARYVYVVWDHLAPDGHGPTFFSRTTDGGATWEAPRSIFDPGGGNQTINNQIVVLPNGTLVNFCTRFVVAGNGSTSASLVVVRSADKGASWSAPIVVASAQAVGARDPETRTLIRDGANLGSIAAGRDGSLAVVWQDSRFANGAYDGIAFTRSTDGGLTWSAPVRINAVPSVQAFEPIVHVRRDGTIGVTYFDLRNNTNDPSTLPTDYWLARSTDGVTWRETHVAGPFDLAIAPNAEGLFVGDYQGLTSSDNVFVPFYAQTNNGNTSNRTDVYATIATSATNAAGAAMAIGKATTAAARGREADMYVASGAPPLVPSAELSQRLGESIARTLARRLHGAPAAAAPGR